MTIREARELGRQRGAKVAGDCSGPWRPERKTFFQDCAACDGITRSWPKFKATRKLLDTGPHSDAHWRAFNAGVRAGFREGWRTLLHETWRNAFGAACTTEGTRPLSSRRSFRARPCYARCSSPLRALRWTSAPS